MKVLDSAATIHTLTIIPRRYVSDMVNLELFNEEDKTTTTYPVLSETSNGFMYLEFSETFLDNSNFQFKVIKNNEIIYRGKIFVTNQFTDLQNFKITNDYFSI